MIHDATSDYLAGLESRLAADGCAPRQDNWGGAPVLVGRRSDFRLRWLATNLHLFTIAAAVPYVATETIAVFTGQCLQYARENKGGLPVGLQTGVAVFPVLVSERVDPAALAWARERQRNEFACFARPVVVDSSKGEVAVFRGKPLIGRGYAGHLTRKGDAYLGQRG
ncbi:levansucrase [Streptomyces corynorhini]|uniref:Levansucrase n=1 Tax=Streptomyces corynorhini TaxID=2282652 RepID=A0A370BI79_9ACTN|nr:levansucrase [Streptomyces corynorhini]RDG39095.1 levansucrase [Streptomyces corynorhini]